MSRPAIAYLALFPNEVSNHLVYLVRFLVDYPVGAGGDGLYGEVGYVFVQPFQVTGQQGGVFFAPDHEGGDFYIYVREFRLGIRFGAGGWRTYLRGAVEVQAAGDGFRLGPG